MLFRSYNKRGNESFYESLENKERLQDLEDFLNVDQKYSCHLFNRHYRPQKDTGGTGDETAGLPFKTN